MIIFRAIEIVFVFSKNILPFFFLKRSDGCLGQRLKISFEELGLTFIKIGQILSMRYDILPESDCQQLQQLLDRVKPVPYKKIEKIIMAAYGQKPEVVFKEFDRQPVGSASVSQVHRAVLFNGTEVAVKVKKPKADRGIKQDIFLLKRLIFLVKIFVPIFRYKQLKEAVRFFDYCLKRDTDFRAEAKNLRLVRSAYKPFLQEGLNEGLGQGIFPRPYFKFCTDNIVVMDYVDGVPLTQIDKIKNNPKYDIEKSIETYIRSIRLWFKADRYVFQGDPHLSNVLVLPDGGVANIDCGLIGKFNRAETRLTKEWFLAVYSRDLEELVSVLAEMSETDREELKLTVGPDIHRYLEQTKHQKMGLWYMEMAKIFVKHGLNFPFYVLILSRTIFLLDGLVNIILPQKDVLFFAEKELQKALLNKTINNLKDINWRSFFYLLSKKINRLPEDIQNIISDPIRVFSQIVREARG